MPTLAYTHSPAAVGVSGQMLWLRPTASRASIAGAEFKNVRFPAGTEPIQRRPSWATYDTLGKSRIYGCGAWTANVLIDENMRFLRQGIPAPNATPAVSAAAGPGVTGTAICYLRFVDTRAGRVGALSQGSTSVALANQSRAWTGIPASCLDPAVDAVQGLVSMDGALPRVAWERQLGVTTITEAVATLALGEAAPDVDFTEMPYGKYNAIYHDRQVVAGLASEAEAVFLSALGFPERYEGLKFTCDAKVSGLFVGGGGDTLLVGTANGGTGRGSIWRLNGFTEGDFVWEMDRPDMGLLGHFGVQVVHKNAIVPTTDGVFLYVAGTWIPILKDRRDEWLREYGIWREDYENAEGCYDPVGNVYTFGPVRHTKLRLLDSNVGWTYWVLNCHDLFAESGGDYGAAWGNDVRARKDTGKTALYLPGSALPQVIVGSTDGYLRLENQDSNNDDDGDTYGKRAIIEPATYRPDAGGDPLDGYVWENIWSHMESESCSWTTEMRAGGDFCRKRVDADFSDTSAASGDGGTMEALERSHHVPERLVGDCLNYAVIVDNAKGFRFKGYGGRYCDDTGGIGGQWTRAALGNGIGPGQLTGPNPSGEPIRDGCGNVVDVGTAVYSFFSFPLLQPLTIGDQYKFVGTAKAQYLIWEIGQQGDGEYHLFFIPDDFLVTAYLRHLPTDPWVQVATSTGQVSTEPNRLDFAFVPDGFVETHVAELHFFPAVGAPLWGPFPATMESTFTGQIFAPLEHGTINWYEVVGETEAGCTLVSVEA